MWRILKWWMMAISIHAPREGSDNKTDEEYYAELISIHAPREGSDTPSHGRLSSSRYFNPRSP